jgi:endonuclease YncB( thermonuclease family)
MPARLPFLALVLALALLASHGAGVASDAQRGEIVARVTDGDTLRLADGRRVRLLQIDAPEAGRCYYAEARAQLEQLAPVGTRVTLEADPSLDRVDRYGRLLRYVVRGSVNVNVELVRRGAAVSSFFDGERGRHARRLEQAERTAKRLRRGLWRRCEQRTERVPLVPPSGGRCDPNYAGCVPRYPPDLDCADIRRLGLDPVRVTGSDPHRLDGDGDGFGCE